MLAIGIMGARRTRQGIGEHVARFPHREGAGVRAIVGTSAESVGEARKALAARGIQCRGYPSLEAMLAAERLDALAVSSPIPTHRAALDLAAEHRLHVLCEKPIVFEPGADLG